MLKDVKKDLFNKYVIALILIFILNAFLKWRFFCGLVMADDFSYSVYAYRLFRIPLPWDMSIDFRMLRFSLLIPVSILYTFLPPAEVEVCPTSEEGIALEYIGNGTAILIEIKPKEDQ